MAWATGFLRTWTVYDLRVTVKPYSQNAHGAVRKNSLKMRTFFESATKPDVMTEPISQEAKPNEK
jgi:hypothetical protein